ncbi:diaminopropionate ammonia-lyase [Acuticoccus sp. M5D2P5]|uniref:diaminopropionate ammonia-lyase n=1 Tax=Acuticoccus kalidii TaxID=2910977 RepID=UPI001F48C6AB|nr:diaminopropionate ammonia-lyase [Acuticoccus kalidii]MCF3935075.1 diaminopropionate ammonia-lyase [Acuticoccus kalidii]
MPIERFPLRHQPNIALDRGRAYGGEAAAILNETGLAAAKREIASWPDYRPTPLVALPGLAARTGVGAVHYKDESQRFGLKSFKALGGAYAVLVILQDAVAATGPRPSAADLMAGEHRAIAGGVTVACATDGNHGRSVAWGAQMFGCRCVIYLHEHVSATREREIARYGAEIRRVRGNYDMSVHQCAADAQTNGWQLVADTSAGGSHRVPSLVMQGYTVMTDEILTALGTPPTHVFAPAAVGGLAAAIVGPLWERFGAARPRVIAVEPFQADCVSLSLAQGHLTPATGDVETFMACLAAGEVSPAAWPILGPALDDAIAIPDDAAVAAMSLLANGVDGDLPLVAGESGCAATAGLIAATFDPAAKAALGLDAGSVVVVIGSEGATDADTYRAVVGRTAEEVAG